VSVPLVRNALNGNPALDRITFISSFFAFITLFLKSSFALLSLLAKNLVHNWTHEAHKLNALSISSLLSIHQAAITGICCKFLLSRYTRTAGTDVFNKFCSSYIASRLPAQRCPHALEGSSNTIASGVFHSYLSIQLSTKIFTHLSLANIGINATSGNSFVNSGKLRGTPAPETIPSTQASHAAFTQSS
jgi:hypothetical protein